MDDLALGAGAMSLRRGTAGERDEPRHRDA
jgi:hypothetical protein